AEFGELPVQIRRNGVCSLTGRQICRRILGFQITPALEGPPRLPLRAHQLRIEYEPAARNPVRVRERSDLEKTLAALDRAPDHPVERSAGDEFISPLGDHARGMKMLD